MKQFPSLSMSLMILCSAWSMTLLDFDKQGEYLAHCLAMICMDVPSVSKWYLGAEKRSRRTFSPESLPFSLAPCHTSG